MFYTFKNCKLTIKINCSQSWIRNSIQASELGFVCEIYTPRDSSMRFTTFIFSLILSYILLTFPIKKIRETTQKKVYKWHKSAYRIRGGQLTEMEEELLDVGGVWKGRKEGNLLHFTPNVATNLIIPPTGFQTWFILSRISMGSVYFHLPRLYLTSQDSSNKAWKLCVLLTHLHVRFSEIIHETRKREYSFQTENWKHTSIFLWR